MERREAAEWAGSDVCCTVLHVIYTEQPPNKGHLCIKDTEEGVLYAECPLFRGYTVYLSTVNL